MAQPQGRGSIGGGRRSFYAGTKRYAIRMCFLGEAGAGKSSLFYRIKHRVFRDSSDAERTQTIDLVNSRTRFYESHTLVLRPDRKTKINLTIMDTGSRERYQSLTAQYYRRTNVILLICSLDNEDSLTRLTKWYAEAQYYIDNSKVIFGVVGMKSDLSETQREVSEDMLYDFARHFDIPKKFIFEVSARTGSGVDEMLRYLCQSVIETYLRGTLDGGGSRNAGGGSNSTERSSLLAAVPAGEGSTINNGSVQVVVPEGRNSKCIRDCCCRCFGACPQCCSCCTCHGKCVIL